MEIKKARLEDINELVNIYLIAQKHMIAEGNINQWNQNEDVFKESIINYINNDNFYIVKQENEIVGFFAMIFGTDKTYNVIKYGSWINNDEYVTIHKIAVKYHQKGIASFIFDFVCKVALNANINNIRIDTHKDNISMNSLLNKFGFIKCGIISITCDYSNDNSLRIAYQKKLK